MKQMGMRFSGLGITLCDWYFGESGREFQTNDLKQIIIETYMI